MFKRRHTVPKDRAAHRAVAAPAKVRRGWLRQRRAATSMEFAIISIPLFVLTMGTMELGFDLYTQEVMDNAVEIAARSVQVGGKTGVSKEKSAQFVADAVCPALGKLLNCNQVVVGVGPIPSGEDYYTNTSTITLANATSQNGSICTGKAGQMMQIQAWYIGPSFVGMLVPSFTTVYQGALTHITQAGASFVNEGFAGGQGC